MAASPRFSSSAKALWAVLGLAAAAFVATILVDELWDRGPSQRELVAAYIAEVNGAQRSFLAPLNQVNSTYASLQVGPEAPAQLEELREAERLIRSIRVRVAGVTPPPKAAELHRELVAVLDLQVAFARDVTELARFLPLLAREDRARVQATTRLQRELREATTGPEQAAAFARYGQALEAHARRLEALAPPPSFEAALAAEAERTELLRDLNERLREGIEGRRTAVAERLFAELVEAVRAGSTPEARGVLRSLDRRARELEARRLAVDRERARLDASLS